MNRSTLAVTAAVALLAACSEAPPPGWTGYAEGDYVYVSSPQAGAVQALAVHAGDRVQAGDLLFRLDAQLERDARDEAAARLQSAQAQVADAAKGRRNEEIAVLQAQLQQARVQAGLAAAGQLRFPVRQLLPAQRGVG